ncbi:MAG TPA: SRPBCC family protein [Acidimicrobiia bacterium]|nr:SRPBCC family protein [Acidimicrobiia bacterium]
MTYPVNPVAVSVVVPAPPDEVFSFVSDTRNDPVWCPNVTGMVQTAGSGVDVGSRFHFDQKVEARGRVLESGVDVEVVELGERTIVWSVEDRFQIRRITLSVEPSGSGSRVTQTTEASFKRKPGMAKWVYPSLAKRTFQDQFSHLVEHFAKT